MQEWWGNLSAFQQILYYVAIPATIILIIQTVMTLMGLGGDGDVDLDFDTDTDVDLDVDSDGSGMADYKFFTVRGLVAFFTIFGWVGIVLSDRLQSTIIITLIALVCGLLAMILIAWLFSLMPKLQDSGNINLHNAIGKTGEVYIPIPAQRSARGKVQIVIQERLLEVEAMTDEDERLGTGQVIEVIGVIGASILLVKSKY